MNPLHLLRIVVFVRMMRVWAAAQQLSADSDAYLAMLDEVERLLDPEQGGYDTGRFATAAGNLASVASSFGVGSATDEAVNFQKMDSLSKPYKVTRIYMISRDKLAYN